MGNEIPRLFILSLSPGSALEWLSARKCADFRENRVHLLVNFRYLLAGVLILAQKPHACVHTLQQVPPNHFAASVIRPFFICHNNVSVPLYWFIIQACVFVLSGLTKDTRIRGWRRRCMPFRRSMRSSCSAGTARRRTDTETLSMKSTGSMTRSSIIT